MKFTTSKLLITADDNFRAFLNETKTPVAQGNDWTTVQEFDVTRFLKAGDNLLAVQAQNTGGAAGLIFKLVVTLPGGKTQVVASDNKVRTNRRPPANWSLLASDDKNWPTAQIAAAANEGPWGKLRGVLLPDPSRLVRVWDIHATGKPEDDPYTAARSLGDRMLLVSNVTTPADMQLLNNMGFTLFQTDSDHLSTEEKAKDAWDWSAAEAALKSASNLHLDWCYFPHEAFPPPWYRQSVPFTRVQCLEHKQPIEAYSPWDTNWPKFIDQGYKALADAFGPKKGNAGTRPALLSALCVGIYGDYGEAGFFIGARTSVPGQKEDWEARFHNLHNHVGWWCDDPAARADFRAAMLKKYGDLEHLNAAWHRTYKTPEELAYPDMVRTTTGDLTLDQRPNAPDERQQWLDFVEWYQSGISRAVALNLDAARKYFPDTLRMLPAGLGDENPRGGNDNSLIPKLAAQYQAEVRSTHGAFYPFAINAVTMLGRLGSASRYYQVPFWTEPQDVLTENQEVQRIFEDLSQGAKGHFDWAGNAITNRDVYYRYSNLMRVEKPIVDVAMFYPAQAQKLRPDQGYPPLFTQACAAMRDLANFDIVDDRMVLDGCLSNYRVLALWEGTVADAATLDKIREWVEAGGVLVAYDFGKVTTFDGDTAWFNDMFGYVQELEPATIAERYVGVLPQQYRIQVGEMSATDYLSDDGWEKADIATADNPLSHRWTDKPQASLRLPVKTDRQYTLVIRATVPPEAAALKRSVLVNGKEVGQLGSPGDVTYRFLIPKEFLDQHSLTTLTFQSDLFQPAKLIPGSKDARMLGVWVQSVQLVEEGVGELADAPAPPGVMRRELDLRQLKGNWSRLKGKGLTIYFPANKKLLKGYFEVLRQAIYHLSEIDPMSDRRDALPIDDAADGVYATLFTDKILYYNPLDTKVTKKVTLPAKTLAAWKGEVAIPKENSWTLSLEPHSIKALYLKPEPQELPFDCEEFLDLGGAKTLADPNCRPGSGPSCVVLPKGAAISTRFLVEIPGRYILYTRCVRGTRPEPVDILIDGQPIKGPDTRSGQTILSGEVSLARGAHTMTLRARAAEVHADFVLLTNDPTIAGYDFALRFAPIE